MATYLLTWNPEKWQWVDLQDCITHLKKQNYYDDRWSCGRSKKVAKGDRLFLIRLGVEPRGICGSGWATSEVFESPHWDNTIGKVARYVYLRFDTLLDPDREPIIPRENLSHGIFAKMHWDTQTSGISIPDDVADELEKLWASFLGKPFAIPFITGAEEITFDKKFLEGAAKQVSINIYERDPQARLSCIQHYGIRCSVCGFDFEKKYGEIGKGFIHVHHLKSLSEIGKKYEVHPIKDLRPVCPNCHAMIHKRKPAYTIEELEKIIGR